MQGGTAAGDRVRFGGTAGTLTLHVRAHVANAAAPRLQLSAVPVRDVAGLRPPGGGTWRAAVAAGRADGRRMLPTAAGVMLGLARLNQYSAFLATPGTYEQARARYAYITTATIAAAPAPAAPAGGGAGSALVAIALAVVGLGGALVLWAHL